MPSRSPIAAAMLNPALLASIAAAAANGHAQAADGATLPWSYAFVTAPLVLHRDTRMALPTTIATHLPTWLDRHTTLRVGFPARARALTDAVKEGIRFGLRHGALSIVDGYRLRSNIPAPTPSALDKIMQQSSGTLQLARDADFGEVITKARFVGRWLTKLDSPATAFTLLGVTP